MYWLIGILIIVAMMAVLSVATMTPLPTDLWFIDASNWLLPLLLTIATSALILYKQRVTAITVVIQISS